jgi:hypothetical protein
MELVEFLLARIGEDEARVKAFADSPDFPRGMVVRKHWRIQLAECAAKRRLIEWFTYASQEKVTVRKGVYKYVPVRRVSLDDEEVLALLALPYADHSDYDPAWNPEATA